MTATQVLFVNSSPAQTSQQRKQTKGETYAFVARRTHARRKTRIRSEASRLVQLDTMATASPSNGPAQSLARIQPHDRCSQCGRCIDEWQPDGFDLPHFACECASNGRHNPPSRRSSQGPFSHPSPRPGWEREDIRDLQFFLEVLGGSVKHYSDSAFFNIVVPCLTDFDDGIRSLVLAVAATHREVLNQDPTSPSDTDNVKALERCNKGIRCLAKQPATISPEVLQTSSILLACWHMLQLDVTSATAYTHAAQNLCQMDDRTCSENRFSWSRNVAHPQAQQTYRHSTFAKIIESIVAKSAVEFPPSALSTPPANQPHRIDINTDILRHPITSPYDVLGALENLLPLVQQLTRNLSPNARLDPQPRLATDLTTRFATIHDILTAHKSSPATTSNPRMASALGTLTSAYHHLSISTACNLLSTSPMAWDAHTAAFAELVDFPERDLADEEGGSQGERDFVFLPFTGISTRVLFFAAVNCRDPGVRRQAVEVLLRHRRVEAAWDSWVAGNVARVVVELEEGKASEGGRVVSQAGDVKGEERAVVRGFENVESAEGGRNAEGAFMLLYWRATEVGSGREVLRRHRFVLPPDPLGMVMVGDKTVMLAYLNTLSGSTMQASKEKVGEDGSVVPMWYDGERVEMAIEEDVAE